MVRRALLLPLVLVAIFGITYAIVSRVALRAYPFSGDEYSNAVQGEIFARGMLSAPLPPNADLLQTDHVIIDGSVRSKYPPGAAALLAIGERAGASWIVTPIEGVIALVLVWLTSRRLFGDGPALVSLLALGLSPLFALQSGTFYAHTAATLWLAASFAATARWTRTRADGWLVLSGVFLGCAFLTRPLDALLLGAALVALRSPRALAWTAVGAAPLLALHFAYQAAQFGSPFTDGYTVYEPSFRAIYGAAASRPPMSLARIFDPEMQWFHLEICASFATTWTMVGAVVLAVFGARAIGREHRARPMRDVALLFVVLSLVALLPMVTSQGDDGPRPRYLSGALLGVAYLAGPGWDGLGRVLEDGLGARVARAVAAIALLFSVVQLGTHIVTRANMVDAREGLYEATRAAGVTDGVVVVRTRFPTRYARNGAFFERPVLYVSAPATMTVDAVAARFPGRAVYEAFDGDPWSIVRRL